VLKELADDQKARPMQYVMGTIVLAVRGIDTLPNQPTHTSQIRPQLQLAHVDSQPVQVLEEFADDQKARLLQFVTGTSGVPSQGFSVLQGNDGNIRRFTVNGLAVEQGPFPRAHTCFNRSARSAGA
jgi:HECT-domain (ubiquitin-transferase)